MEHADERLAESKQVLKSGGRHVCRLSADDIMPLRVLSLLVCLSMLLPAAAQAEAILEHLTLIAPAAPGGR